MNEITIKIILPEGASVQTAVSTNGLSHATSVVHSSKMNDSMAHFGAMDRRKAAEYLSISTRLLDDLMSAKKIKKIKIGRKTLVRKTDLDNFLEGLAENAN